MRYLGIDYGKKRIGLSLSDEGAQFAFAKETVPNDATAIDRIGQIAARENVGAFVIGDARALSGAENPITNEVEDFAKFLGAHTGLPVEFSREAWSSMEAARFAPKGKEHDDAAAAAIILQRFLDQHGPDRG